jgi:hypothetical protein
LSTAQQDSYLDEYLRIIKATDPLRTALVFSSGLGAVRTTFGMVAALLVRRKQLMMLGLEDPYAGRASGLTPHGLASTGANTVGCFSLSLQVGKVG